MSIVKTLNENLTEAEDLYNKTQEIINSKKEVQEEIRKEESAAYTAGYKDGINYICDTLVDEIKEIIEKRIKDGKSDYDLGTNYGLMKCAQIVDQVITEKRSKL